MDDTKFGIESEVGRNTCKRAFWSYILVVI